MRPLGPDTRVGKFIAKRGPGMHHVAYAVADIEATLASLKDAGIELIDSKPRVGIRGTRVAFLGLRSTGSVLTEIVETSEINHG
jgi:methylmalonyl-CoA epimerase